MNIGSLVLFDMVLEGGPVLDSTLPLDSSSMAINTFREENARVGRYGDVISICVSVNVMSMSNGYDIGGI